ncbi:hypothetical protein [Yinghuangia soli]|uniref:Uncharacterized protein n=1 Tax=Yinghuangia soli TaxID=2908204 RepID=A0AA41Q5G3_9ACTN|nr:hypothetical protein [Yinghuangia soli]MCF2530739.1 hypothetical protein [Yinghuangia soli]
MDERVALSLIRMAAADMLPAVGWGQPPDAQLVRLGVDALCAGVDSPSLAQLAGLGRNEYGEARDLFVCVLDELGLVPLTGDTLADARWIVARWWIGEIAAGRLEPLEGAMLIGFQVATELGHPAALEPFFDAAMAATDPDHDSSSSSAKADIAGRVVRAAREFVAAG